VMLCQTGTSLGLISWTSDPGELGLLCDLFLSLFFLFLFRWLQVL